MREAFERTRFYEVGTDLMGLEIRLAMVGRWFIASVTAMVIVGPAIVWLGGGWLAMQRHARRRRHRRLRRLPSGRLYGPASALVGVQVQIVSALAVFERIFEYLDMKTEGVRAAGCNGAAGIAGDVDFDERDIRLRLRTARCCDDVSFHIEAGQIAAFVGPSGAGKSTITATRSALLRSRRADAYSSTGTTCST